MKKRETLSSNTLFNFTTQAKYFYKKIEYGFAPRFCLEDLSTFYGTNSSKAFPMVCFCDIPISQLKDHIWRYGKFGIGLTKEWGVTKMLHPVLYYPNPSSRIINLLNSLKQQIKNMEKEFVRLTSLLNTAQQENNETGNVDNHSVAVQKAKLDYAHLVRYLKLYATQEDREGLKFYDEKEWRYLPVTGFDEEFFMNEETFNNAEKREEGNRRMYPHKIDFSADDVKFLIVPNEKKAEHLIKHLKILEGKERFTHEQVIKLTRKVLTVDEIENDF